MSKEDEKRKVVRQQYPGQTYTRVDWAEIASQPAQPYPPVKSK